MSVYQLSCDAFDLVEHDGPVWEPPNVICDDSLPFKRWFPNRGAFCRGTMELVTGYWLNSRGEVDCWMIE